jgi:hypothetical protein
MAQKEKETASCPMIDCESCQTCIWKNKNSFTRRIEAPPDTTSSKQGLDLIAAGG